MIRQYGDHPSILVWSMHNESPYAMTWMKHRDLDQNRALSVAVSRPWRRRLDPLPRRAPRLGDGRRCYYYGWYDGKLDDAATAKEAPLVTEYGAAALPAVDTLRTMFDATTIWPRTIEDWETWKFADFQPKTTFDIARVKQGEDLRAFVAEHAALPGHRSPLHDRAPPAPQVGRSTRDLSVRVRRTTGRRITWSVLDYYRRPKLGYAAVQAAMQRLLPSLAYDPQNPAAPIAIFVVNDFLHAFPKARVAWHVIGAGAPSGERVLDLPADAVVKVADLGPIAGWRAGARGSQVRISSATPAGAGQAQLGRRGLHRGDAQN